jgi:hypothetical protein
LFLQFISFCIISHVALPKLFAIDNLNILRISRLASCMTHIANESSTLTLPNFTSISEMTMSKNLWVIICLNSYL